MRKIKPIFDFTHQPPAQQAEGVQVLEDGIDVALGQALRYRRQAAEYRKLAEHCDQQAAYWDGLVNQLRQEQPGQWSSFGQYRAPGGR